MFVYPLFTYDIWIRSTRVTMVQNQKGNWRGASQFSETTQSEPWIRIQTGSSPKENTE